MFQIPGVNDQDLASLQNVRKLDQYIEMVNWILNKHCGFCTIDTTKNKTIYENEHWRLWINPYPQDHHEYHLVIPHKRHIVDASEITQDDIAALGEVFVGLFENSNSALKKVGA